MNNSFNPIVSPTADSFDAQITGVGAAVNGVVPHSWIEVYQTVTDFGLTPKPLGRFGVIAGIAGQTITQNVAVGLNGETYPVGTNVIMRKRCVNSATDANGNPVYGVFEITGLFGSGGGGGGKFSGAKAFVSSGNYTAGTSASPLNGAVWDTDNYIQGNILVLPFSGHYEFGFSIFFAFNGFTVNGMASFFSTVTSDSDANARQSLPIFPSTILTAGVSASDSCIGAVGGNITLSVSVSGDGNVFVNPTGDDVSYFWVKYLG